MIENKITSDNTPVTLRLRSRETYISSNEIMMEAVEDSKKVNEELVKFLETSLKEQKKNIYSIYLQINLIF